MHTQQQILQQQMRANNMQSVQSQRNLMQGGIQHMTHQMSASQNLLMAQPGVYQELTVQVMHINQRIKIRVIESETLAQFYQKLLLHFEITDKNSASYLGLFERIGKDRYEYVTDKGELKHDHLYYLYFREKPDKNLIIDLQNSSITGEEESKKSKNSGTASWGSQAYKNSGIITQNGRRITSNNGMMTFQGGIVNMASAHIEKVKRPKEEKKILICPFEKCLKEFSETGNLKTHMRTHTGERPFVCQQCDQQFITKGHLQAHELTHTGEKPFKCPHPGCTKRYSRAGRLKIHQRLHTGERPFICQMEGCEKAFREKGNLLTHMRIHNGQKPFRCDFADCDMSFTTQAHLTDHQRRHSGERPFSCEVCDEKFMRSSTLKIHIRRHTGEKPYQCLKCERAFSESGNLRTHQKIHEDDVGNSSLGKRSRRRSINSRFTTPAVSPCLIKRRVLKLGHKNLGLKTLNPSGNRYKNSQTPRSGYLMEEDENPKIIFDSDNRRIDDEDCSPTSPLRLKMQKMMPQIDFTHPLRGTANTTKVGSSITAIENHFDIINMPQSNRNATENSSSQNTNQSNNQKQPPQQNKKNSIVQQQQINGKNYRNEMEEIKLPMIKIDQTQQQFQQHNFVNNQSNQQFFPEIFSNTHKNQLNRIDQYSLPGLTPLYHQGNNNFQSGSNIFGDTPMNQHQMNNQAQSNQSIMQHQQQSQQTTLPSFQAQQLAMSLNSGGNYSSNIQSQAVNTQAQQNQGSNMNSSALYYPFSPTGILGFQNQQQQLQQQHQQQHHLQQKQNNNINGGSGSINNQIYSPKGPHNFLQAFQQVNGSNNASNYPFLNTPTGIGESTRIRQHAANSYISQQLLNASANGITGSAGGAGANFLDDSASNRNKSSDRQNGCAPGAQQMIATTSSFNQQHQFLVPQNIDKYSPRPQNSSFERKGEEMQSFADTVQNMGGNRLVGQTEASPKMHAITKKKIINGLTPTSQQQSIKLPGWNAIPLQNYQVNFSNLSALVTNKLSSQPSSALTTKEAQQDEDPQSFTKIAARMCSKDSPFLIKNNTTTMGGTPNLIQESINNPSNFKQGSSSNVMMGVQSNAFMSAENSAFKKSSPKVSGNNTTANTTQNLQNSYTTKAQGGMSGGNTPRIFAGGQSSAQSSTDQLATFLQLQSNMKKGNPSYLTISQQQQQYKIKRESPMNNQMHKMMSFGGNQQSAPSPSSNTQYQQQQLNMLFDEFNQQQQSPRILILNNMGPQQANTPTNTNYNNLNGGNTNNMSVNFTQKVIMQQRQQQNQQQ